MPRRIEDGVGAQSGDTRQPGRRRAEGVDDEGRVPEAQACTDAGWLAPAEGAVIWMRVGQNLATSVEADHELSKLVRAHGDASSQLEPDLPSAATVRTRETRSTPKLSRSASKYLVGASADG